MKKSMKFLAVLSAASLSTAFASINSFAYDNSSAAARNENSASISFKDESSTEQQCPIEVVTSENAEDYVKSLLSEGVQIKEGSVKFYGSDPKQIGIFTNAKNVLPYNNGIILSSGDVTVGFNKFASTSWSTDTAYVDEDLKALFPDRTLYDTAALEFTIIADGSELNFNYNVFSNEYTQASTYCDAFALFVNGENIAYLPNGDPINVYSIRQNELYTKADDTNIGGYEGVSNKFKCSKEVNVGDEITIKLAVSDTGDHVRDTAIAIQGASISFSHEVVEGDYTTDGIVSEEENPEGINDKAFHIFPAGDFTQISTDGINWSDAADVTEEGMNVPYTFYLRTADGVVTQSKTVYYNLKYPVTTTTTTTAVTTTTAASTTVQQAVTTQSAQKQVNTDSSSNPSTGAATGVAAAAAALLGGIAVVVTKKNK